MKTKIRFQFLVPAAAIGLLSASSPGGGGLALASQEGAAAPTLEETRLTMNKWIETQQIISKERNEWQQAKEILTGRLELIQKEQTDLEAKLAAAQASVTETDAKRSELMVERDRLVVVGTGLNDAVARMESEVPRLFRQLPEPLAAKIQPLFSRIPEKGAATRVSAAERFQNVLGILNELNKDNNEISVSYEVHELSDGKPAEVRAMYVGLAQAYYVSSGGDAGIGRPSADGWKWEPSKAIAGEVVTALEIIQGKQTPRFLSLPVRIQ
ncbi:MAG: DUF3450 family protein [Planctomycetota bacterium]